MPGSFRFVPPEPRSDVLPRPRLLRSLAGRWQHRITSLVGGAGLGKTTLLAQAIAENRMAPRGEDVWIGVEPADADADRLARVIASAIEGNGHGSGNGHNGHDTRGSLLEPAIVADSVWHRAPTEACLMFDDVHNLPQGSPGAAWLAALIDALPANGHVVFASRFEPPVPLTRFGTQGQLLRLAEEELRFSDDELTGFASRRGVDPSRFDAVGGWPAMAELAASVSQRLKGVYLWEEVLEPLGTVRRHVLAVLCDLGGGDDELASAAVGTTVELDRTLDGVPLVARSADGWFVPHGLWRTAPGIDLDPIERATVRRRAVEHLSRRARFDEAFVLLQGAELWDLAPQVLRSACLTSDRLAASQLGRWLASSSDSTRSSTAGKLAGALHTALTTPARAIEPLQQAAAACEADRDSDGEMAAIAQLGWIAWWRQDNSVLGELLRRVTDLEAAGHPMARGLAAFGRALVADLGSDNATALAELETIDTNVLDPAWAAMASWLEAEVRLNQGQAERAAAIADRLASSVDPAMAYVVDTVRLRAWWAQGRVDDVIEQIPGVIENSRETGVKSNQYFGLTMASTAYSITGDVTAARRCLVEALGFAPPSSEGEMPVQSAVPLASLQFAEGDEVAAIETLRHALEAHGLDRGLDRRAWRMALALTYVLLPETREHWDSLTSRLGGRRVAELAALVVAVREGDTGKVLRAAQLPSVGKIRSSLHVRFAAELAVGLASVGRSEGRALLDALGPPGRTAVRELAAAQNSRSAKSLLAAVPAPPPRVTYLAMLGPMVLRRDGRDGVEVVEPDLRRKRVQALLAFLAGHRRTTRAAIMAALWPDLDERAAANNLGVTLTHLLRVLEPWRDSGDPPYLLRHDGQTVQLQVGDYLRIDVDDFDGHLAAAAKAEADGTPSVALEHDLAVVGLYRDQLGLDVTDAPWLDLDREHYRTRFVGAAVRAGQLLLGRGDLEQAQLVAHRVLAVDEWSEEAYGVLVGAAMARGDRSSAHRLLARCRSALAELGVEPSVATQQLLRRLEAAGSTSSH